MSHENTTNLPDSVPTGGAKAWRIAQGKIIRGRTGEEEERGPILGHLIRIGTHYGTLEDGRAYARLECEVKTNRGVECVGTALQNPENGKPTLSSSISFAEGLLECAQGELIQIEAVQGQKTNRYGSRSTYARVSRIDPLTMRAKPRKAERGDGRFDEEYLDELVELLKAHPAYAERPARDAGPTHRSELDRELKERGWPDTDLGAPEWLAAANQLGGPFASIDDVPDDVWGAARQTLAGKTEMPKFLQPAVERGEFDP
jgi:hypothetical protein